MLHPKHQFLSNEKAATEFRSVSRSDSFKSAVTHSLAQFSLQNPTEQQMAGVNIFIGILLEIAEPISTPGQFPDKSNLIHFGSQPKSTPTKK